MKIRSVVAELLHADGPKNDKHSSYLRVKVGNKTNSQQICAR